MCLLFPDENGLTRLLIVLDSPLLVILSNHRLQVHGLIITARRITIPIELTRRLRR